MRFLVISFLLLLTLLLGECYVLAPVDPSKEFIMIILIMVILLLILSFAGEKNIHLKGNMFTVKNIFLVSFIIVFFQAPLDYVLGYDVNLDWFFDMRILCKSVAFSALCLSVFLLGYKSAKQQSKPINEVVFKFKNITFFVLLGWLCLFIFIQIEGLSFFNGGYGSAEDGTTIENEDSARFFNYLLLCLQIVVISIIWNNVDKGKDRWSIKKYFSLFPISFLTLYFGVIVLWLCAGGRAISLSLLLYFICGYIILSKKRMKIWLFVVLLIAGGFFLSVFKNMGGLLGGDAGTVDAFNQSREELVDYAYDKSIFLPTRELSYSIYVNNVLFDFWDNGGSFYGFPLLLNVLKSLPGGVALISLLFGVDITEFSIPSMAQDMVGAQHGLGNSCIAEFLVSIGFWGTLLMVYLFGVLFRKFDNDIITYNRADLILFVMTFSAFSTAFFIPRGSFLSIISQSMIIYFVLYINKYISKLAK